MNLDQLRTLVSIMEEGSLSAAARARGISQPAISRQVQRLEAELGVTLLLRHPRRPLTLAPAGERVLAFARETLARWEALERDLATGQVVEEGLLSLAASTIPGEYLLPRLLAAFRAEHPHIRVRMTVSDTAEVLARLLADEADVGVVGADLQRPGLHLERWLSDEVILVVPPDHPFAGRRWATVAELSEQPLLLRERGSGTRRSVEAALAAVGYRLPRDRVRLVLGSTQAILQAVTQGLGVGFVSALAAEEASAGGRLACLRLTGVNLRRDLYLAYQPRRAEDPLVASFLTFARSYHHRNPARSGAKDRR